MREPLSIIFSINHLRNTFPGFYEIKWPHDVNKVTSVFTQQQLNDPINLPSEMKLLCMHLKEIKRVCFPLYACCQHYVEVHVLIQGDCGAEGWPKREKEERFQCPSFTKRARDFSLQTCYNEAYQFNPRVCSQVSCCVCGNN